MYYLKKSIQISASHQLHLPYESKCTNLHGHNWNINIYCKSKELNESGMILDFTHIKTNVMDKLDHKCLNDILDFNTTAENLAKWICEQVGDKCYKVDVEESDGNLAIYER
jgi:6-pyruvoyltetrahydropterin/6-carboxytetrahydropterin synthase